MSNQGWRLDLGATTHPGDAVAFRVWAPEARQVVVRLLHPAPRVVPLAPGRGDFHEAVALRVPWGTPYTLSVDGGPERPDPFSRSQPAGALGPSRVVGPAGDRWLDPQRLRPSRAAGARLLHDGRGLWSGGGWRPGIHPAELLGARRGDAVLLGPVTEEMHEDGLPASLFAPSRLRGGSRALRALVVALHEDELAAVLRLPYAQLSSACSHLLEMGPWVERRPDGQGLRLDLRTPGVRDLAVDGMLGWMAEFGIDALELPAAPAWRGVEELRSETARRAAALGLAESPLRLTPWDEGERRGGGPPAPRDPSSQEGANA